MRFFHSLSSKIQKHDTGKNLILRTGREHICSCLIWGFNISILLFQTRLQELHRLWELLLEKMREKGVKLLQAQKLVQFLRECEDVMDWINDKVLITWVLLGKLDLSVWKFPSLCSRWSSGSPRELLKAFHFTGTFYLGYSCCMSSRYANHCSSFCSHKKWELD